MPEEKVREMTRGKKEPADAVGIENIIPILVGIIGGLFVLFFPFGMAYGLYGDRKSVSFAGFVTISVADVYSILIVISLIFLGFLSACILGNRIRTLRGAVRAGIVTAVPTLPILLRLDGSFRYISPSYIDLWIISPFLPIFTILSLAVLFQAVGAVCGYFWIRMHPEYSNPLHPVRWELIILKPTIVTMAVILAIIIVPAAYSHAIPAKLKFDGYTCYGFYDAVGVERVSEDTIRITQLMESPREECPFQFTTINKISLDDYEVSNQSIIRMNGLSDTIDPPEGLVYAKGSQIILKGPDVSNKSHDPLIRVMKYRFSANGSVVGYQTMAEINI